jgi:hypothetical protein
MAVEVTEWSLDHKDAMSRAFDAGNDANAYETRSLAKAWRIFTREHGVMHRECTWPAFVIGFFGTYALTEIVGSDRDIFDAAYRSAAGRYVVEVAKYADSRGDEYATADGA